jgi:predicted transcriptional regulator
LGIRGNSRLTIKQLVFGSPGVHLMELQRLLGMSFNTTRYHVDKLTKAGEIVRVEERGFSRLYPRGMAEEERTLFAVVRSETDRKILSNLAADLILSNKQLSDQTNLAKSTISEHLAELIRIGIVRARQIASSGVIYELAQPERIRVLLKSLNPSLREKAADRFIDLWDF